MHQQHISTTYIINKSSPQGTQRTHDVCTIFFLLRTTILVLSATTEYITTLQEHQLYNSRLNLHPQHQLR
jgi:hypothetical protein